MSDDCKPASDKAVDGRDVSRRDFLNKACGGAAIVCGGAVSLAMSSDAQAEYWERSANVWKSRAGYQNYSNGPARCAGCLHFRPPQSCAIVEPWINPNGSCRFFSPIPVVYAPPEYSQPYYPQPEYPPQYYPPTWRRPFGY